MLRYLIFFFVSFSLLSLVFSILGVLLALYLFFSIFVIVIGKRWFNAADDSNQYPMPGVLLFCCFGNGVRFPEIMI